MFWVWPGMIWAGCRWRRFGGVAGSAVRLVPAVKPGSAGRAYGSGANALAACGDGTCTALHPRCGMAARCRTAQKDALAALETGDAVCRRQSHARKVMDKPIPLLCKASRAWARRCLPGLCMTVERAAQNRFVAVNCAALPESLIEAELFGYQGAFTGARREGAPGRIREAHGGTLFSWMRSVICRCLFRRGCCVYCKSVRWFPLGGGQPVAVDFALVCATHRQFATGDEGRAFSRRPVLPAQWADLQLPALRERSDFDHLLDAQLTCLVPDRPIAVAPDLRDSLRRYSWPGNVRQLANACEQPVRCWKSMNP